jgi:hypothetical protein
MVFGVEQNGIKNGLHMVGPLATLSKEISGLKWTGFGISAPFITLTTENALPHYVSISGTIISMTT